MSEKPVWKLHWEIPTPSGAKLSVMFFGAADRSDVEFLRRATTIIQETIVTMINASPSQSQIEEERSSDTVGAENSSASLTHKTEQA